MMFCLDICLCNIFMQCPQMPEGGIRFPGPGVTGCNLLHGCLEPNQGLFGSSKCSCRLSHHSIPVLLASKDRVLLCNPGCCDTYYVAWPSLRSVAVLLTQLAKGAPSFKSNLFVFL